MSVQDIPFNSRTSATQAINPCNKIGNGRRALIYVGDNAPVPLFTRVYGELSADKISASPTVNIEFRLDFLTFTEGIELQRRQQILR